MYAIIEDGGQQFRVSEGDTLTVDLRDLAEDAKEIELGRVLMVNTDGNVKVGTPVVEGAKVLAEIEAQRAPAVAKRMEEVRKLDEAVKSALVIKPHLVEIVPVAAPAADPAVPAAAPGQGTH